MSNKDEMMHASVADIKWNAPLVLLFHLQSDFCLSRGGRQ